MKFAASRQTKVGFELESMFKKVTLDKMRLVWNWPRDKNWHTDYQAAQKAGVRVPIIRGHQLVEYIGELFMKFFGEGYIGGELVVKLIGIVEPDDEITTRGVVRGKIAEGDAFRLTLDVWCENQRGEKVAVGQASGLVLE